MKNITIAGLIAAPLLVFALAMPSLAADPPPRLARTEPPPPRRVRARAAATAACKRLLRPRQPHLRCRGTRGPHSGTRSRRDDDLRGWHDEHVDRQGHVQRPWRSTESRPSRNRRRRQRSPRQPLPGVRCPAAAAAQLRRPARHRPPPPSRLRRPSRRRRPPPAIRIRPARLPSARTAPTRSPRTAAERAPATAAWPEWLTAQQAIAAGLFAQQRLQGRPNIVEQDGLTRGVRVNVVVLQEMSGRGRCRSAGTAPRAFSSRAPNR